MRYLLKHAHTVCSDPPRPITASLAPVTQTKLYIFHLPRRFHMAYAPLGRWISRREPDARRAENLLILALTALLMGIMFANQIAWAFVKDAIVAAPEGPTAMAFWLAQVGFLMALFFGGVLGFKPALALTCGPRALHIQEEGVETVVPYDSIDTIRVISALAYHRHFRRYRQTRSFVNQIEAEMVLLETTTGPVILGLPPEDHQVFIAQVERQRLLATTSMDLEPAQVA